ncbi:MAG: OmpA family protein, partial [Cyclobacteriaceae bacterium]
LNKIEEALNVFEGEKVIVQGHTDSQGSDESNIALSRERAKNVKNYITDMMDVEFESIKAVGYGESQPLANNEHAAGRAKNRRIDIVISSAK